MDKLAKQLRADAAMIDVQVSDELDRRIAASLQGITPENQQHTETRQRPALFWWASSLTGIAAALVVIGILNSQTQPENVVPQVAETSPVNAVVTPTIDWKAESAMLTQPLHKELLDLQADIKKAEDKVKQDIGF